MTSKKHHHAYEIDQPKKTLIPLRLRGKRQNKKGPLNLLTGRIEDQDKQNFRFI